jgi:hypothetical protein
MANAETSFGLRPVGLVGSAVNSTGLTTYEIASDNSDPIYQYGIVTPTSAGVIAHAGATNGGTTAALGVLMGVEYVDATTKKTVFLNYWPGSASVSVNTAYPVKALVADNPDQLFCRSGRCNLDRPCNCTCGCVCKRFFRHFSTDRHDCKWSFYFAIGVSTIATTATLPLRIVGLVDDAANSDYASAGAHLLVRLNAHFNAGTRSFDSQTTANSTGV